MLGLRLRPIVLIVSLLSSTSCFATTKAIAPEPTASPRPAGPPGTAYSRVIRVIDGDTIVLSGVEVGALDARTGGRKARLIGIDTPEVHGQVECLGREASAFAKRTLEGKTVRVSYDVDPIDLYGRALVYIWTKDGTFVNGLLVAEGFALPFTVPPNVRYADLFVRLAAEARTSSRGLWRACRR